MADSYFCSKCKHTLTGDQFYISNNQEKYPLGGRLNLCKKCLTMHVDNWNPDTYLPILQEVDVPYVPSEWNTILTRYGKNKAKVTGMTILGRYLSKMRLTQYRDYRFKDSEYLQEQEKHRVEETMKRQGYDIQEIDDVIQKGVLAPPPPPPVEAAPTEDYFAEQSGGGADSDDIDLDLTDEDRVYLRLKWGKTYRPEEWVRLEQLYEEMMQSYDIQTAGHIDTLKLICKTSLKAN